MSNIKNTNEKLDKYRKTTETGQPEMTTEFYYDNQWKVTYEHISGYGNYVTSGKRKESSQDYWECCGIKILNTHLATHCSNCGTSKSFSIVPYDNSSIPKFGTAESKEFAQKVMKSTITPDGNYGSVHFSNPGLYSASGNQCYGGCSGSSGGYRSGGITGPP